MFFNFTANEADGVNVKSFPTLKLWKKDTNKLVDYSGARDFETLAHFVRTGEMKLPEKPKEKKEPKPADKKDELWASTICCKNIFFAVNKTVLIQFLRSFLLGDLN